MKRQPERTCIGCRGVFSKKELIRIIAGSSEPVVDYREKMPGRAAYVCPRRECFEKAVSRDNLSKAIHIPIKVDGEKLISLVAASIREKAISLISMAAKAGKLSIGYSAVRDAIEKGRAEMILYAEDLSDGTRGKIQSEGILIRYATLFTCSELGRAFNREVIGVLTINEKRLADAVWKEAERLKSLININE